MKTVSNKMRNVLTVVLIIALMVLSKYSFADTTDKDKKQSYSSASEAQRNSKWK